MEFHLPSPGDEKKDRDGEMLIVAVREIVVRVMLSGMRERIVIVEEVVIWRIWC